MSKVWQTQYGPRRVKRDMPTLDEAIFAAQGLSDDPIEQAEIAASLIGADLDEVKARMAKAARLAARNPIAPQKIMATGRNQIRAVVVERRPLVRTFKAPVRRFS